jgi:hypothetical protein
MYGVKLVELHKTRFGEPETLYQRLTRPDSRSIGIPVRMNGSGAPGRRSCTADFKIKVVDKWLRENGAKVQGAKVGLGISLDEFQRVKPNLDPDTMKWKENAFPLIDLRITRQDCMNIIQEAGLPIPPKSSCYFCPYHRLERWQEMRQSEPELFQKSADLETLVNERRQMLGLDPVWFTRKLKPLEQATSELRQRSMFDEEDDDVCESGYCFM